MSEGPGLRLRRLAERRLPALTRQRAPESLPIRLHRRRIYILPTGFGIGFAVLLMVMLVGALNYANNAALLLTCLLGGIAVNSMTLTFRALDNLSLDSITADTVHAGDQAPIHLHLAAGKRAHHALRIDGHDGCESVTLAVSANSRQHITLPMPTQHRGWMTLPRLRLSSTWPFGLFRAWSWMAPDTRILVYPRIEGSGPPPRAEAEDNGQRRRRQGEETAALRDYRPGDPRKLVAWKASARHLDLLVRDADAPATRPARMLDWHALHGLDRETRISRLARWVAEAHAAGSSWTLRLERETLGPSGGTEHFHRCMRTLALLP